MKKAMMSLAVSVLLGYAQAKDNATLISLNTEAAAESGSLTGLCIKGQNVEGTQGNSTHVAHAAKPPHAPHAAEAAHQSHSGAAYDAPVATDAVANAAGANSAGTNAAVPIRADVVVANTTHAVEPPHAPHAAEASHQSHYGAAQDASASTNAEVNSADTNSAGTNAAVPVQSDLAGVNSTQAIEPPHAAEATQYSHSGAAQDTQATNDAVDNGLHSAVTNASHAVEAPHASQSHAIEPVHSSQFLAAQNAPATTTNAVADTDTASGSGSLTELCSEDKGGENKKKEGIEKGTGKRDQSGDNKAKGQGKGIDVKGPAGMINTTKTDRIAADIAVGAEKNVGDIKTAADKKAADIKTNVDATKNALIPPADKTPAELTNLIQTDALEFQNTSSSSFWWITGMSGAAALALGYFFTQKKDKIEQLRNEDLYERFI